MGGAVLHLKTAVAQESYNGVRKTGFGYLQDGRSVWLGG